MTSQKNMRKRELWASKAEFFLATLGYSIGMGCLTRFPYMVMRNGGGAFLIPFSIAMLVIGIPLFYLEVILGQFSGQSPLTVWAISPAFKGIGYAMTLLTLFATSYYMNFTWSLVYLIESCQSDVPWRGCNNTWNTPNCAERVALSDNDVVTSTTANASIRVSSPAEEYWNEYILDITGDGLSDIGSLKWYLVLARLFSFVIIFLCVIKGPSSSGKVVYVTATLPYALLTVLLIRGLTLEGSLEGVMYFLRPDWQRLSDYNIWLEATIQVVFQLGPAWGCLITMSRYNGFYHKSFREAVVIPIGNLLTAAYGGLAIFSVLGYMAEKYKVPIDEAALSGPGLAFVAYPEAIAQLPLSPIWAVMFFLMLISVAIDRQLAFFETIVSGIVDMFPRLRRWKMLVSALLAIALFLSGLPLCSQGGMYVYVLLDWYGPVLTFTLIAFLESVVIAYIYGLRRFYSDVKLMFGSPPNRLLGVIWFMVTPVTMAILAFVGLWNLSEPTYAYTNYTFPHWSIVLGWCIAATSFLPVPVILLVVLCRYGSDFKRCFKPTEDWVPAKEELVEQYRKRWYRKSSDIYTILAGQETFEELFCDMFLCNIRARTEQLFGGRHTPPPPCYEDYFANHDSELSTAL